MYTTINPLKTNGLHHPVGDGPLDIFMGASFNLNLFFSEEPFKFKYIYLLLFYYLQAV